MKQIAQRVTVIGFLLLLFGFSAALILVPDRTFSQQENRSLTALPQLTVRKLATGEYASNVNDYFADQFPMRDWLVGQKGIAELVLGKGENNGILLGENGQLARRLFSIKTVSGETVKDTDAIDFTHVREGVAAVNRLAQSSSVPISVLFAGRNIDVMPSAFFYPNETGEVLCNTVRQRIDPAIGYIDMVAHHRSLYEQGEAVYYQTDHHWTTRGAYEAYCEIMKSFGMENEILDEAFFEKEIVQAPFYGTLWSAGGMKLVPPDHIELWHAADDADYEVIADGKLLDGFYNRAHLARKDHYSVFLDGVHDVVTITEKEAGGRPVLLLLKDSYANSVAPFLARHFDLVLLNLSSSKNDYTNISEQVDRWNADRVLLLYGLENVITTDKLTRLR